MGNAESSTNGGESSRYYHVLRVSLGSPAAAAKIEPFFDFLKLESDVDSLTRLVEEREGREITLQVYSSKRRETRSVKITPSRSWVSGIATNQQPSLLGLSLRACNPEHALDQVYHVLGILANSPGQFSLFFDVDYRTHVYMAAESAGLVPHGDWIVGYSGGVLRGEGDFYEAVERSINRPLQLFVYNADYDVMRSVILVPNREWGGEGLLGCGVGYGLLHRIPRPQDREGGILVAPDEQDGAATGQGAVQGAGRGGRARQEGDVFVDSTNSNRYSNSTPSRTAPAPSRRTSDGYEEASYTAPSNDFSASAGVEIVAKEDSDSFTPTPSYNNPPPPKTSAYGYGPSRGFGSGSSAGSTGLGYSRPLSGTAPPRSSSSGVVSSSIGGAIGEEDEGDDVLV